MATRLSRWRCTARRSTRAVARGFVLPFVLVAITVASMLAFAFTAEAVYGMRGQRGAAQGVDVAGASDAALAQALESHAADSLWMLPLGVPRTRNVIANGTTIEVQWQRQQPLVASLRARSHRSDGRRWDAAAREHYRAVWLAPPPLPVVAALSTNGTVVGREGTQVSGRDVIRPDSPCGIGRDTTSVEAVVAPAVREEGPGGWPDAPPVRYPPPGFLRAVQAVLGTIGDRLPVTSAGITARAFPPSQDWTPLQWRGSTVTVTGPTRWTGMVVVRGNLVVTGSVNVTGLLVVDGHLDATAASLSVQGAVVAVDTTARGVMLGARSDLRYDRCAVQMALAAVARPTLAPFSLWHSLER